MIFKIPACYLFFIGTIALLCEVLVNVDGPPGSKYTFEEYILMYYSAAALCWIAGKSKR